MDINLKSIWADDKVVGNGGHSGVIYVPKTYTEYYAKIIVPDGNGGEDIITKTIGRGRFCGVIYIHRKNIGKEVKVVIPKQKKPRGVG